MLASLSHSISAGSELLIVIVNQVLYLNLSSRSFIIQLGVDIETISVNCTGNFISEPHCVVYFETTFDFKVISLQKYSA